MKTALKLFILSIITFSLAIQAAPASDQSIEQLLKLTKTEELMNNMLMKKNLRQAANGKNLTPDQQAVMDKQMANKKKIINEEFSWDKIKDIYVQAYRETFSQEEINGLINFYKTPIGQTFVDKQPELQQRIMTLMQPRMMAFIQRMQTMPRETKSELSDKKLTNTPNPIAN